MFFKIRTVSKDWSRTMERIPTKEPLLITLAWQWWKSQKRSRTPHKNRVTSLAHYSTINALDPVLTLLQRRMRQASRWLFLEAQSGILFLRKYKVHACTTRVHHTRVPHFPFFWEIVKLTIDFIFLTWRRYKFCGVRLRLGNHGIDFHMMTKWSLGNKKIKVITERLKNNRTFIDTARVCKLEGRGEAEVGQLYVHWFQCRHNNQEMEISIHKGHWKKTSSIFLNLKN